MESSGKAEQEFLSQMNTMGSKRVAFPPGTCKAMYEGMFTWNSDTLPKNFASFLFWKPKANDSSMKGRFLILHKLEKEGKIRSEDDMKKALKQGLLIPTSFQDMIDQMLRFRDAQKVIFGSKGHIPRKYSEVIAEATKLQDKFEDGQARDPKFCASFMYLIDVRVNEFIKSCMQAEKRSDARNILLTFSSLLEKIELQEFNPSLPFAFKIVDTNPNLSGSNDLNWKREGGGSGSGGHPNKHA